MYKQRVLRFGLDYLKYNFLESFKDSDLASFFIGLSANSNEKEINWFGYWFKAIFTHVKGNSIIQLSYEGITVLQLKRYDGQDMAAQYLSYSLDFYGAYFYNPYLKSFYRQFYKKYGEIARLSRADIACDVNSSMAEFRKAGWVTNFDKFNVYGENAKTGIEETRYFGSKLGKNKRHLIRVYNKKADIKFKKKFALHKDYFSYKDVTRVELELRSTTCKDYGLTHMNMEDEEVLKNLFTTFCLNPKSTDIHFLKGLKLESSKMRKLSLNKEIQTLSEEARVKRVVGGAYNLLLDGCKNILIVIFDGIKERGAYRNQEELLKLIETINNYITK